MENQRGARPLVHLGVWIEGDKVFLGDLDGVEEVEAAEVEPLHVLKSIDPFLAEALHQVVRAVLGGIQVIVLLHFL